jgi:hypothetical protein
MREGVCTWSNTEFYVSFIFPLLRRSELHRLEQVVTSSQHRSHFLRHIKGCPQVTQTLLGRFSLLLRTTGFVVDCCCCFPLALLLLPPRLRPQSCCVELGYDLVVVVNVTNVAVTTPDRMAPIVATENQENWRILAGLPLMLTMIVAPAQVGTVVKGSRLCCSFSVSIARNSQPPPHTQYTTGKSAAPRDAVPFDYTSCSWFKIRERQTP